MSSQHVQHFNTCGKLAATPADEEEQKYEIKMGTDLPQIIVLNRYILFSTFYRFIDL